MGRFFVVVKEEVWDTLTRPSRLGGLFSKKRFQRYFASLFLRLRYGSAWTNSTDGQFANRNYRTYDDYVAHQQSKMKFGLIDLTKHDVEYREILRKRLQQQNIDWAGKRVLCLAARLGTEVKSFIDLGCFAVGTDILPGENNPYVVYGDFHNLQFAPRSVDVVFCNAIDHAFDVHKIFNEVAKVLVPGGTLLLEVMRGTREGVTPQFFESFGWATTDDLIPLTEKHGFKNYHRFAFSDYTYPGEQLYFRRIEQPAA